MPRAAVNQSQQVQALEIYSDYLAQFSTTPLEADIAPLLARFSQLAPLLQKLHEQWTSIDKHTMQPLGGFSKWFPNKIGPFQILRPLNQSNVETVCLARHLTTNTLSALRIIPGHNVTHCAWIHLDANQPVLDCGIEQGIHYLGVEYGAQEVLARDVIEPKPTCTSPHDASWLTRFAKNIAYYPLRATLGAAALLCLYLFFTESSGFSTTDEVSPAFPQTRVAWSLIFDDQRDDAIAVLDQQLEHSPNNANALALRIILNGQEKSLRYLAWLDYEWLYNAKPDSYVVSLIYNYLAERAELIPQSIPVPRATVQQTPQTMEDFCLFGLSERELKRWPNSAAAFNRAVKLDEKCFAAQYGKAEALAQIDQPKDALLAIEKAMQLNPEHAAAKHLHAKLEDALSLMTLEAK